MWVGHQGDSVLDGSGPSSRAVSPVEKNSSRPLPVNTYEPKVFVYLSLFNPDSGTNGFYLKGLL